MNSGITWNPIFDDQPDYSIGDVAIAPTDPDIIWVGTGEANFRQNVDSGFGIYKSEDGGKSWRHMGLTESRHTGRIKTRRVEIAGISHQSYDEWMRQIARNLTDVFDGFLRDTRFLIHDRDPLFSATFRATLAAVGVKTVKLPARSANL